MENNIEKKYKMKFLFFHSPPFQYCKINAFCIKFLNIVFLGTDIWDSSEKHRSPAWCDRILWKGSEISQLSYISQCAYKLSDHKPILSNFRTTVKMVNNEKYRKVYEEALKRMDKLENEFLPQVTVDIPGAATLSHSNRNEIHFGQIKFMEPVKKSFTIANTGQVPVKLEFIKKLNDTYVCKEWLRIEPQFSFIRPGKLHFNEILGDRI